VGFAVSFTKGCYIGQEIIARMDSRHRLAKTLVCLRLSAVVPIGSELYDDEVRVGTLTSITNRGQWHAGWPRLRQTGSG